MPTAFAKLAILTAVVLGGFLMGFGSMWLGGAAPAATSTAEQRPAGPVIWRANLRGVRARPRIDHRVRAVPGGLEIRSFFADLTKLKGATSGAFFVLPKAVETKIAGQHVEFVFETTPAETGSDQEIGVMFSSDRSGDARWQSIAVGNAARFTLRLDVPPLAAQEWVGADYIGFVSDTTGGGKPLVISAISLSVVP